MIYAVYVAIVLTAIICLIEVHSKCKACLRAYFCLPYFIYLLIFIAGNVATTLFAQNVLPETLPASLTPWSPFLYGFLGVFAFRGIISNINVTFFKNGVLTIEDWIEKAKDNATARVIEKVAILKQQKTVELSDYLKTLPELTLNTYIIQYLGSAYLKKIETEILNANVDPKLYRALTLATEKPDEIDALRRKSK